MADAALLQQLGRAGAGAIAGLDLFLSRSVANSSTSALPSGGGSPGMSTPSLVALRVISIGLCSCSMLKAESS